MNLYDYIEKLNARYRTGISTEHSFRGDLQNLLESLLLDISVLDHVIIANDLYYSFADSGIL